MPAYLESKLIDTSSINYGDKGINLKEFITKVFGLDVLQKVKREEFVVWFDKNEVKAKNLGRYRVKENTMVVVKRVDTKQLEIDGELLA